MLIWKLIGTLIGMLIGTIIGMLIGMLISVQNSAKSFKKDGNNAIKSAIPWKSVNFVQKMMKNTRKVIMDAKKEAKRDANHKVLL